MRLLTCLVSLNITHQSASIESWKGTIIKGKFIPEDTDDFNIVEKRVTIDVGLAKPQLSWFKPNDIDAGTELNASQLNAKTSVEEPIRL